MKNVTVHRHSRFELMYTRAQLESIFLANFPALYDFARRSVGPQAAEDIIQQVMVKIAVRFRSVEAITIPSPLDYLYTTIDRLIIDQWRREQAYRNTFNPVEVTEEIQKPVWRPLSEEVEIKVVLRDEVRSLEPIQRNAYILCEVHGLTDEEAAKEIDVSVRCMKSRLQRARKNLRTKLQQVVAV